MESEPKDTPTAVQSEQAKENERLPDAKAGRVIIRNLGFDLREKHLKNLFLKFG
jgi:RNA recognition motif-containing protein